MPSSDSAVGIVSGVTKDRWEFVQSTQQSFQIVSVDYPEKCLAAADDGNLSLVTKSSSTAATTQYWYLLENGNGYIIENVASHEKLSVSTQNGALTCTLSDEEQVWTFMDYVAPEGVVTFEKGKSDLFLKNLTGKAYEGEDIGVGSYEYTYDKCGFRLRYDEGFDAYYILPIASCNGQFMALTAKNTTSTIGNTVEQRYLDGEDMDNTGSNDWDAEDARSGNQVIDHARQLFLMEWHLDGSYTLILDNQGGTGNNPVLVLTANSDNTVTLSPRNADLSNQKWNLSAYQYQYKNAEGVTVTADYTEVENYYRSFGFGSPFGINGRDLIVISDFGARYKTTKMHNAIDLRASEGTVLRATIDGIVVDVGSDTNAGNFVKIDTGIPAFGNSNYTVCIGYMHMKDNGIEVSELDAEGNPYEVSQNDRIGLSGNTGVTEGPHLHYAVFLHQVDSSSYSATANPINPFLFLSVNGYDISKGYVD